jgi:hypothetical protein
MSVINIRIVLMVGNFIYIRSESVYGVIYFFVATYVFFDRQYLFFGCIYDQRHYAIY